MKSQAISVENVSKVYRLGEINRAQFFGDVRRWFGHKLRPGQSFGDPSAEAEEHPEAQDVFYALRDISFDVEEGESLGIIGVNGAGKSTLLKLISRITLPSQGRIRTNGRVGSLLEVGTGFHPDLTGRDNVYMNGAILGMNRREVEAKFDEIVAFSGVEKFIDTPVKRYSSGMYVRLAFSVATFLEPEILILDEVLAVGDMAFQQKCRERMDYFTKKGHTMIFVAHDIGAVTRFCSKALWLKNGRMQMCGPAEEVCDAYRKESIATLRQGAVHRPDERGVFVYPRTSKPGATGTWFAEELRILDARGRIGPMRLGEACEFRVSYRTGQQSRPELSKQLLALVVNDEQGRRALGLRTDQLGLSIDGAIDHGSLVFHIPRLPLLPGFYTVMLRLWADGKLADEVVGAGSFEVVDGDFYGSGRTPLRAFTPLCVEAAALQQPNRNA